jgi:hypothetical protein
MVMPKITKFEKVEGSARFLLDKEDGAGPVHVWVMRDGQMEEYMEAYGLQADQVLSLIALDIVDDTVDIPGFVEPGMRTKIDKILAQSNQVKWGIDKAAAISKTLVPPGSELAATWRAEREQAEALAAGYQRRQEELQADEIVSSMNPSLKATPRRAQPLLADLPIGLAIKVVP